MNPLYPKKNPDAARELLATLDDKLTGAEVQKKYFLALYSAPVPCPMCFEKVNLYDAADDTCAVGEIYNGRAICPNCGTELAKVVPYYLLPGAPGWHWRRKYPVAGKKQGQRLFSAKDVDLLDAGYEVMARLLEPGRHQSGPAKVGVEIEKLQFVTTAGLSTYLYERGWTTDETSGDEASRTWKKIDGSLCSTRGKDIPASLAKDIEAIALGERVTTLQILVELLALKLRG